MENEKIIDRWKEQIRKGEKEGWILAEDGFDEECLNKYEAIFCQGNGYLGVRGALEERYTGEVRNLFVAGTFDRFCESEVTELPNFPDMTQMGIYLDGKPLSFCRGTVHEYQRALNLENGESVRIADWEDERGRRFLFIFRRMVSLRDEHVMASRVEICPADGDAEIKIMSGIDGRADNSGTQHFVEGEKRMFDQRFLQLLVRTAESGIDAGCFCAHRYQINGREADMRLLPVMERRQIFLSASCTVRQGEVLAVEKISCVYTSRDLEFALQGERVDGSGKIAQAGLRKVREAWEKGYESLIRESGRAWKELWERQDVRILSEKPFDQTALRFALYHLNIMVKKEDERMGIGAKALSGEGYKGHSFWDTEVFLLPYYLLTQPETAGGLVGYRYLGLEGARRKARQYGYQGAMYPWEAAWIDDGEVTPVEGPADVVTGKPIIYWTGVQEQHITADVAFAAWQYYKATEDTDFLLEKGFEMIMDTARFWVSRLDFDRDRGLYVIRCVIGPDEYKEHVDNDVYTNYMAHYNMRLALELVRRFRGSALPAQREVYERLRDKLGLERLERELEEKIPNLYLPVPDSQTGIIPQCDGYFELEELDIRGYKESEKVLTIYEDLSQEQINSYQIAKQGDLVVLMFLMPELFDEKTRGRNYRFYEDRTLHDSSLSKSTHSILACDLGLMEEAYRLFQGACRVDLGSDKRSSDAGIHSASMGGIWQAAVMGFGGVRMEEGMLHIRPSLPKEWDELVFPLVWKGRKLLVRADRETVTVENDGPAVEIILCGKRILAGERTVVENGTSVEKRGEEPGCAAGRYEAVIFDLDGVICHTDNYHYQAWKKLADRLGIAFDQKINNRLRGVSRMESLEIILEGFDGTFTQEEKESLAQEKNDAYRELLKTMSPQDLGGEVKSTLEELRRRGLGLAIGSSSKNAAFILERIGLGGFFDAVSDGTMITRSKPDPEVFLKAAQMLGADPVKCLVVEDAEAGLQAAKAAGMDAAGIGEASRSDIADYRLESFSRLLELRQDR